jgi:hypothetical protein
MYAPSREEIRKAEAERQAALYKVGSWHRVDRGAVVKVESITGGGCWMSYPYGGRTWYSFEILDILTIKEAARAK